jgi:flagellar biosynthesis protein FlhA
MKLQDLGLPVLIIGIVVSLIQPLPHQLLDGLLALNIAISAMMLMNAIFSKRALELSVFPSLLLITTVFRLTLNVTAMRLILGTGNAGEVIQVFGNKVGEGNIAIGFIVFVIIMIVQFLVITKGTERVSEVAARFTLDAMPGKQMAIDADLNAGLINEAEAKDRRKTIQREADFYGAMDGATKFVKGDAIAGIIITVVNFIGGVIVGMVQGGLDIGQVFTQYTILTIGDGLVSQIPALMISVATGIIVTKAGSEGNLGEDVFTQMFGNYRVLFIGAGLSFILAFVIQFIPFMILSIIFTFVALRLMKKNKAVAQQEEVKIQESEVEEIRKPENVINLLQIDPIELEFGYGIIPLADVNQGGDLLDRVVMIRRQLALELGMIVPVIRLRDNIQLSPNAYSIKIKGVEVSNGDLMFDHFLAMNPGTADEDIPGVKTIEPAFGLPAVWIPESSRDRAEMLGYTVVDPPSVIATHLTEIIKKYAHELMGRQEVQTLVDNIKQSYPAIVDELVPKIMSVGEIQKVIANLLKEGVSIRDMVTILETLADYAPSTRDPDLLTEYVRQALGRSISKKFIGDNKSSVITLDPKLEQMIMDSLQKTENGNYLAMEPSITNTIMNNLTKQVQRLIQLGQQPIVLASPVVRLYFKRISEQMVPGLVVLSYNELDPTIEVQAVGTVSL